jgi:hypothetical protein
VAAAGAAWLGWQELWAHGGDRPLVWKDLTGPTIAEPVRSELRVFDSRETLLRYLRGGGRSVTLPPAADFAFDRFDAVLIAAGPRSSSAYELDVLRVTEERRRIVVTVRERTPTLAQPGAARLTFPFRLIAIERRGKDVTLDWEGRP